MPRRFSSSRVRFRHCHAPAVFLGPGAVSALSHRRFSSAGGRRAPRLAPRTTGREKTASRPLHPGREETAIAGTLHSVFHSSNRQAPHIGTSEALLMYEMRVRMRSVQERPFCCTEGVFGGPISTPGGYPGQIISLHPGFLRDGRRKKRPPGCCRFLAQGVVQAVGQLGAVCGIESRQAIWGRPLGLRSSSSVWRSGILPAWRAS